MNAATYSFTAAITGNWDVGDFLKCMGMGAVTGTLGVGTSLLGTQLGSFGNSFAYGLLSNMVNNTISNTIFGESISFEDIPGMVVGAFVSSGLPTYSPLGTNGLKNFISEIGIKTFRGAMSGYSFGMVNGMVHNDPSLVWKGAVGGSISGFSRTVLDNAIFGAGYQPQDENGKPVSYGDDGIYRKGGIASLVMRSENKGGGFSHGRYVFTEEKGAKPLESEGLRKHENKHLQQMKRNGGYIRFYRTITGQYMRYGFDRGPLEDEANKYGGLRGKSPKKKNW